MLAHRAHAPLFENIFGFIFVNFNGLIRIYFNCLSQRAICTECILFFELTEWCRVCVKGHWNNSQTPRISTVSGLRPLVLNVLDPPLLWWLNGIQHVTVILHYRYSWINVWMNLKGSGINLFFQVPDSIHLWHLYIIFVNSQLCYFYVPNMLTFNVYDVFH